MWTNLSSPFPIFFPTGIESGTAKSDLSDFGYIKKGDPRLASPVSSKGYYPAKFLTSFLPVSNFISKIL